MVISLTTTRSLTKSGTAFNPFTPASTMRPPAATGGGGGDPARPAKTRAERVEHAREARGGVLAPRMHDRGRIEVHVVRVRAPRAGGRVGGEVAVPKEPAAPAAELVAAAD